MLRGEWKEIAVRGLLRRGWTHKRDDSSRLCRHGLQMSALLVCREHVTSNSVNFAQKMEQIRGRMAYVKIRTKN